MTNAEKAAENFLHGYNCAQSVLSVYAPQIGLDEETAMKLASSFGGGMGRLREVCGTVSAMFMVAGLVRGYTNVEDLSLKREHYKLVQDMAAKFKDRFGTINCAQLLKETHNSLIAEARTPEYYKKRPCVRFVRAAAEIIDEMVFCQEI